MGRKILHTMLPHAYYDLSCNCHTLVYFYTLHLYICKYLHNFCAACYN